MLKLTIACESSLAPPLPDPADSTVQVWRDHEGVVCAYGYTVCGEHWMYLPGLASFCLDSRSEEVMAVAVPPARPELILNAYCRGVLPMALQARGTEVLHASAVWSPQGVVAFCGASGTGKSTIAFGLSRRGYCVWADDAVAFEASGTSIKALPLPFEIRLRPAVASFLDDDRTAAETSSGWQSTERVDVEPAPLAALYVIKRTASVGSGVSIERLRPSSAFAALLPHAYCFSLENLERKRRMMEHYLDLTARVPVFEIRFESGLEKLPAILDAIEQLGLASVSGEESCR